MSKSKKSKKVSKIHDWQFKKFLTDIRAAEDFLRIHLPAEIQVKLDFSTLALAPGSYVDEKSKQYCSDILYSVRSHQGEDCYIYCVIEHQSIPDPLMPFRLLRYSLAAVQQYLDQSQVKNPKKIPLVVPLLFYHGTQRPYPHSMRFVDCFEDVQLAQSIYSQPFPLVDVSVIPDDEIVTHRQVALLELVMKHIFARDMLVIGDKIAQILNNHSIPHEQLDSVMYYIAKVGEVSDAQEFLECIAQGAPNYREDVMTLGQQLEQKGLQQGLQQGRQDERIVIAKQMLAAGIDLQIIKNCTGLPEQELSRLNLH